MRQREPWRRCRCGDGAAEAAGGDCAAPEPVLTEVRPIVGVSDESPQASEAVAVSAATLLPDIAFGQDFERGRPGNSRRGCRRSPGRIRSRRRVCNGGSAAGSSCDPAPGGDGCRRRCRHDRRGRRRGHAEAAAEPHWSRSGGPVDGRKNAGRVMIATAIAIGIVRRKARSRPPRPVKPVRRAKGERHRRGRRDRNKEFRKPRTEAPAEAAARRQRRRAGASARETRAVRRASVSRARAATRTAGQGAERQGQIRRRPRKGGRDRRDKGGRDKRDGGGRRTGSSPPARRRVSAIARSIPIRRLRNWRR